MLEDCERRRRGVPLENIKNYFDKKKNEYTQEAKAAKDHQDAALSFAQTFKTEDYKNKIRLLEIIGELKEVNTPTNPTSGNSASEYAGTIQEKFWQFFVNDGYSKQAVAGMMGNVQHESGFISDKIEQTPGPTNGEGYGLIQWSYGRKQRLIEKAKSENRQVNDVAFQLEFLKMELDEKTNWLSTWADYPFDTFKKTTDIKYATEAFCWMFERPNVNLANIEGRIKYSKKYYDEFANRNFSNITSSGDNLADQLIAEARKYNGCGYTQNMNASLGPTRYGPTHWDCSSLMQKVFRDVLKVDIGVNTTAQENCGTILSVNDKKPGDLCFFGPRGSTYHVGLYVGNNAIFHASNEERGVLQDTFSSSFSPNFIVRVKELM